MAPQTARFIALLALACAALLPADTLAVDWEGLVNPGPVIDGHADIEKQCRSCHAPFARDEQRGLCLACHDHDEIAADIDQRRGFHGRHEPARTGQCRNCHTDHEGRDADIVRLTPQTFDHALTDFALEGAHARVSCGDCHEPRRKHREAPRECSGCHADEDVHRKALGEDCASCHVVASWGKTNFDHARASDPGYPLTGAHARVGCGLCHAGQRYENTPTTCVACHRIDDTHQGRRGTECQSCHNTTAWKEQTFDHQRKTGFALTQGHSGLACVACHAGNDFRKTNGKACIDCHRSDDTHRGRNGVDCQACHSTRDWSEQKFDHARATKFMLRGAHAELGCVACHKGEAKQEKLETSCVSCHRGDDPHGSAPATDCGSCHGEESWTGSVRFDHDLTGFPLVGLHATTSCESCHLDRKFAQAKSACIDCHRRDDVHEGHLGDQCGTCHTPNDWRIWTFDHDTQTDFDLTGAHRQLRCVACHLRPPGAGRPLPQDCGGCHRRDDVHGGQFGADCARCHDTRTFSGARRRTR